MSELLDHTEQHNPNLIHSNRITDRKDNHEDDEYDSPAVMYYELGEPDKTIELCWDDLPSTAEEIRTLEQARTALLLGLATKDKYGKLEGPDVTQAYDALIPYLIAAGTVFIDFIEAGHADQSEVEIIEGTLIALETQDEARAEIDRQLAKSVWGFEG